MDELKLDFSVFVSSMKHMPPWNEDQNNEHLKNTIRSLLETFSGGRTVEMLKDVLSTEERRALLITNDQFSNQNENETTNENKDRAVGRSENPGVPLLFGGHNLPHLVEIGLTDLPKSGGATQ